MYDNLQEATDGNGSGELDAQPSDAIMVHWSCPAATKPKTAAGPAVVSSQVSPQSHVAVSTPHSSVALTPIWDQARRELWFDGHLIKRFRQPSPNQETILAAFQEEGWPSSIDDPLPHDPGQEPKRRLHFTIRNLNRGHKRVAIHFAGDGTGQGVTWKRLAERTTKRKLRRLQRL